MTKERLATLLDNMGAARLGVIGDFCLDLYWHADMTRSVLSRETPHFPLPVISETASPGAAGNVACNIAALQPRRLMLLGACGEDWRGILLQKELSKLDCDVRFVSCEGRKTNAYIKPMLHGYGDAVQEQARLDFENDTPLTRAAEDALLAALDDAARDMDVLCVCDQMANGTVTPRVREHIMEMGKNGLTVIADSRDHVSEYRNVIVKPNEIEAARALDGETDCAKACAALRERTGRLAVVTAGADGSFLADENGVTHVPAWPSEPPFDICGAGDTFLSAFACALASGAKAEEAAKVGCMASAVTIRKLGMTGTATREEILSLWT